MSNFTNLSNSTSYDDELLLNVLLKVELAIKSLSLLEHLLYMLMLVLVKEMRKRGYLYVNHAAVTNVFFVFIQFAYSFGDEPNFADQRLNQVLCSISELFWPFSNYIRIYSLLLIAVYRYLATFRSKQFKVLNSSRTYVMCPLVIVWIVSVLFPVVFKYVFRTGPSITMCFDGDSDNHTLTVLYYCVNFLFMVFMPSFVIGYLYMLIIVRLKKISQKLAAGEHPEGHSQSITWTNHSQMTTHTHNNTDHHHHLKNTKKERHFAQQFILMCVSMLVSGCLLCLTTLRNVLPDYYGLFRVWRPVFRTLNTLSVSLIPIISIYFNPSKRKILNLFLPVSIHSPAQDTGHDHN